MYSNQPPPIYTTRHYIHDPQSNATSNYNPSYNAPRPSVQPYPYYTNSPQPTTVTYINDRPNYAQQSTSYDRPNYAQQSTSYDRPNYAQQSPSYVPPNSNRYSPPNNNYNRNSSNSRVGGGGGGSIEKTNTMSNENPFYNPARTHEQVNTPRSTASITSPPKGGSGVNKTLNLSDENPFHSIYGGYHYPAQIDPSKRITTQPTAARSTENKSLNLSDENPFFSTYGRYVYPSQIDPQKRITEMPKAAAPLAPTNETSDGNPLNTYRPQPSYQNYLAGNTGSNSYSTSNVDWNRNNNPAPLPYRPIEPQRSSQNYSNQPQPSSFRPPSPPSLPPPARLPPQKANPSAPLDKTSLNMSPDNPFAETYGRYHYPSQGEVKTQKRAQERNTRFADQPPVINNNNSRPIQPTNQMTEYPETEQKEIISGKGQTKFTRFDVNF